MKKIRILSLDGGGIRGILPGTILTYIEKRIKEKTNDPEAKIGEYFDFIAGTSTGGILGLIYLCPDEEGKYKYSAAEALNIYLDQGDEIFDVSLRKKIESVGGVLDEKYNAIELEAALNDYFKDVKLSEIIKPCIITSYDIRNRKAHFFTSHDATADVRDYYIKDVARATSAAPTYFEPVRIKSIYGSPHALIDGGMFANNPSLCAYAEARTVNFSKILNNEEKPNKPGGKDMLIVSIGTGSVEEPYHFREFKDAGITKWIKPLIDIMMSGNSETVDYQLKQVYETLPVEDCKDYYRIQPKLTYADSAMDNARMENLRALYEDGLSCIKTNKEQLDEVVEKLIGNH